VVIDDLITSVTVCAGSAINGAWQAVCECSHPCGITRDVLEATRHLKVDVDGDVKRRLTKEDAVAAGWTERGPWVGKSAADVYCSNAEREFHNLALDNRMPLQQANDILKFVKSLPNQGPNFESPNIQTLHDKLLEFCQGSAIMRKSMNIGTEIDMAQLLEVSWKDPWSLLKRMLQVKKFKDQISWQPSVLRYVLHVLLLSALIKHHLCNIFDFFKYFQACFFNINHT
jgi:hypothetical protein